MGEAAQIQATSGRELGPKCTEAFHRNKHKWMLELFSWWSFVYREKERVFREDGNEMMESQQSTCYPESQKTPTEISPNIKKKKRVLPAEHKKKGKGYMKHWARGYLQFDFYGIQQNWAWCMPSSGKHDCTASSVPPWGGNKPPLTSCSGEKV